MTTMSRLGLSTCLNQTSYFLSSPPSLSLHHSLLSPISCRCFSSTRHCWRRESSLGPLHASPKSSLSSVSITNETITGDSDFIQIGYICNVHGLKGELRVKPTTDFPELRLAQPGRRWLRISVAGKETIQEIELSSGSGHPSQKTWILTFSGIDSVDKARQLVGSTLLVREEDRPTLEEGEFYTPDLVGMRVIMKETGKLVGSVVNVFNCGPSHLLQVKLDSGETNCKSSKAETHGSSRLVWVPFAEAIVPDVDMDKRELHITPPKGLLELNQQLDGRSKKERRQLEWKERRRAQQRLLVTKKKLSELGQKHIMYGLSSGDKAQKTSLVNQILSINLKLFGHALEDICNSVERRGTVLDFMNANSAIISRNTFRMPRDCLCLPQWKDEKDNLYPLQELATHLLSEGKIAFLLTLDDRSKFQSDCKPDLMFSGAANISDEVQHREVHLIGQKISKLVAEYPSAIFIIFCPTNETLSLKDFFEEYNYFSHDREKVWFLDVIYLPVVSCSFTQDNKPKILLKTPWEVLQSRLRSGGIFCSLACTNLVDILIDMGIQYMEVSGRHSKPTFEDPLFLGFAHANRADVGIKVMNEGDDESDCDMIFSIEFMKKIIMQTHRLKFYPVVKQNEHVERVDDEWVEVSSDSYELQCSIYSSLNLCDPNKVCVFNITDC
ncbi:uncharacterized protein LOC18430919 isoform X1 [Amborella trichopoda]|uniref:RimM N-terminal domain-containing protein n=1 Tax=Amborella trichopoda TaxID=13333 RepID=W1NYX2_AMBTC|nr:uncharacterized protein LOC18430919 isoform X1 [Amborella trichopoda]ERN02797.1 hypothetical protein AMTR_s00086p00102400 [Amborella trichopoda]|eukprot:XP_006841122.1 uncharacterized protein LOC18430919 isoform X1 [Amborella trichopoda]